MVGILLGPEASGPASCAVRFAVWGLGLVVFWSSLCLRVHGCGCVGVGGVVV